MAALLDLHPDTDPVSSGVADLHAVIDRLHTTPRASSRPSVDVAEVDRVLGNGLKAAPHVVALEIKRVVQIEHDA